MFEINLNDLSDMYRFVDRQSNEVNIREMKYERLNNQN